MISSAIRLFGCCRVANERKSINLTSNPDGANVIHLLGLPGPATATNSDLELLRPVYIELLNDNNGFYDPMFEILDKAHEEPDADIVLLYFLEYPQMVRAARNDETGMSECSVDEKFPLHLIFKKIAANKRLARWCREAIRCSRKHHELVLVSAIGIINSSLHHKRKKSHLNDVILQGTRDFDDKLKQLYVDLGAVVARPNLPSDGVITALNLLSEAARLGKGDEGFVPTMLSFVGTPENQSFQRALERVRVEQGEQFYQQYLQAYRAMLEGPMAVFDPGFVQAVLSWPSELPAKPPSMNQKICDAAGCVNKGSMKCARCKLVAYCSKDCQVAHWKCHKAVCRKAVASKNGATANRFCDAVETCAEQVRRVPSAALLAQDTILAENPDKDYVIFHGGDIENSSKVFYFEESAGKALFKIFRTRARDEPHYVYRMYDFLTVDAVDTKKLKSMLRQQLKTEYGVDPLGPAALDAAPGASITEWLKSHDATT